MFNEQIVIFSKEQSTQGGLSGLIEAPIFVDKNDHAGVRIAGSTLAQDFGRVTGRLKHPYEELDFGNDTTLTASTGDIAIIVGSIDSSRLIHALVKHEQLNVLPIQGRWEAYQISTVKAPDALPNYKKVLVIVGSDKRGTIFGAYTLSEQIGVSPYVPP
jgi:hypothetical protein